MSLTKRPATDSEVTTAMALHARQWNLSNPSFEHPDEFWQATQDKAISEGYKNEVCSCGVVFLAFHHFTTCRKVGCPFSDGISLLDRLVESCELQPVEPAEGGGE